MKKQLDRLLSSRAFSSEDKEAIRRVHMLLVEYAWSMEGMTPQAADLKQRMLKIWAFWKRRSP